MQKHDVIIIGAGLSGLTCAKVLHQNKVDFLLIEASERVGGRVKTDIINGFRLDRGFQIYLTAYPDAAKHLDYSRLNFHYFRKGAIIWNGRKFKKITDPLSDFRGGLQTVFSRTATLQDKFNILKLRNQVVNKSFSKIEEVTNRESTLQYLEAFGFSKKFIKIFLKPFLGGVFLEKYLDTNSSKFEFVFKMFAEGDSVLPERGMEEIPKQLAEKIPTANIITNARVTKVQQSQVFLEQGEVYKAKYIVLATDLNEAMQLVNMKPSLTYHPVTCLYFSAPKFAAEGQYLYLNGSGSGSVNNVCFPTEINAGYGNGADTLVSVTVLGGQDLLDHEIEQMVTSDLKEWFGSQVDLWNLLKIYHIKNALPQQSQFPIPQIKSLSDHKLLSCGDYHHFASINSAIKSGESVANTIISQIK
jgi:hypothetical protein